MCRTCSRVNKEPSHNEDRERLWSRALRQGRCTKSGLTEVTWFMKMTWMCLRMGLLC